MVVRIRLALRRGLGLGTLALESRSVLGPIPVKIVEVGVLPRSMKKTARVIDERYDN